MRSGLGRAADGTAAFEPSTTLLVTTTWFRTAPATIRPGGRRRGGAPRGVTGLFGVVRQHPADHLFLAGSQVDLSSGEQGVPEDELDIGQRQGGILGHPVGGCMPQRVQGRRAARRVGRALEHAVRRVIGQWADGPPQGPPQRLPPALEDQPVHLHLVKAQPDERVGGRRQLLNHPTSLAHHRDQLPPGIYSALSGRQQLRCPCPGGDIERDQRPVPVRGQPGEDLVELLVRDAARDPSGQSRPIQTSPLVAVRLHRIVVRVRSPAPPRPVQRERVHQRPAARVDMELVETTQHRLGMRTHRRRINIHSGRNLRSLARSAPVRARRLASHQHPTAEIPCLDPCRSIPRDLNCPQESEPSKQIYPIRAGCRLGSPGGLQIAEERRHRFHRLPARVHQSERQPRIARLLKRSHQGHR